MRILIEDSIWLTNLTYPDSETVSDSTDGDEEFKLHNFRDEMPAVSRTFEFKMHSQLALISFVVLFWLYNHRSDYSPT
jgi:hypothetical protein